MNFRIWSIAAVGLLGVSFLAVPAWSAAPDDQAIRAYLQSHPEVVLEVLSKHREALYELVLEGREIHQRRIWRANIKKSLRDPLKPKLEPGRARLGNPKAPMLIVEYSDFLCPSCRRGAAIMERLLAKHPDQFQLMLKHLTSGELSKKAALYYEAIARQSPAKAERYYRQMFKQQDALRKQGLKLIHKIVQGLDLDQGRLARDLADPALAQRIKDDAAEGKAFHLGGTPAFVVAGVAVRGAAPMAAFEDVWALSRGEKPAPLPK